MTKREIHAVLAILTGIQTTTSLHQVQQDAKRAAEIIERKQAKQKVKRK